MADLTTVEIIHARLFARYGSAWKAKYAGLDVETVQKDWMHELDQMPNYAIDYALDYLPTGFPPTAGQFREICRRAPEPARDERRLAWPPPNPDRLKSELERLHKSLKHRAPRQWAYDLQAEEAAGGRLCEFQRRAWRVALASVDVPLSRGSYTFMQEELPPGMRKGEVDPEAVARLEAQVKAKLYAKRDRAASL
jgi:hypothetical protein